MNNSTKYETNHPESALNDYSEGYDDGAKLYSGLYLSEQGTHRPTLQTARSKSYNSGVLEGFYDAKELDGWPVTRI